jgi:hypothetical protein
MPIPFRSRYFFANAFTGDFTLKLRKRQQDILRQSARPPAGPSVGK